MKKKDQDKIQFHSDRGIWKDFARFILASHLPWLWIIVYVIVDIGVINIGLDETAYTAQLFAGDVSGGLVSKLIIVMIINTIGSTLVIVTRQVVVARINRNARRAALEKVLHLPMNFFKSDNPRETITRIISNTEAVGNTLDLFILPCISGIYAILAIIRQVAYYDIRLVIVLVTFIPFTIIIGLVMGRINYSLNRSDKKIVSLLTEQLSELITNIPVAKAFAKEKYEAKRGGELSERLYRVNIKGSWMSQIGDLSFSILSFTQSLLIIFVGLFLLGNEEIEMRVWIAFYLFSGVMTTNIQSLLIVWENIKTIQGGARRIADIMVSPQEENKGQNYDSFDGTIVLDNVYFEYQEDKLVLQGVNCCFEKGKATAILGISGCGKSTIVNLIDRIYKPQQGTITIDGVNIQDYELDHYRSQFSFISQDIMLFSGTIKENLIYGLKKQYSDEELLDVLKKVGAYDFVMKLHKGLYEEIGEYGNTLSGGQRQRIALARTLLEDSPYMILDEATASMDTIATTEIIELLKAYAKDRTIIAIAHSPNILSLVNNVVVIENGKVSVQATVEEAKEKSQFIKDFLREGEN